MSLATFKRVFTINLLAIFALLLHLNVSASTSPTTYTITDLTATDVSFACQANLWTASRLRTTNIYQKCGTNYILGGYNVLGGATLAGVLSPTVDGDYYQRIYTDIPSHNLIQFSFTLFAIDGWVTNYFGVTSKFQLNFDSVSITGFTMSNTNFPSNLCGGNTNDLQPVYIYGTAVHSSSTLTIQIVHQLGYDSAVASIGIRNLTLSFLSTTTTGSSALCATAPITLPAVAQCSCTAGQYRSSGTCTACDSSCATCYGGTSSQCYTCASGYLFNGYQCILCNSACSFCYGTAYNQCSACASNYWLLGNNTCVPSCNSLLVANYSAGTCKTPCTTSTDFVLWDGSCSSTCTTPLVQGNIYNVYQTCSFPCPSTSYMYWNGTCSTTCPFPLTSRVQNSRLFCDYPCTGSNYLYNNGSCLSGCSSPFSPRTEATKLYCDNLCATTQHLYWNGSCITAACLSPLVERTDSVTAQQFCQYPCLSTQFLYWNGTCGNTCSSPLSTRVEGSRNFCDYPCVTSQFLFQNATCTNSCPSPMITRVEASRQYCDYPCTSGQNLYWNSTCLTGCASPLVQRFDGVNNFCDYPCLSTQYLYWNGTCSNVCSSPLLTRTEGSRNFCDYPCASTGQHLYWNGTCASTCASPLSTRTEASRQYCDYPCTTTQYLYWNTTCGNNCASPLAQRVEAGRQYCDNSCPTGQFMYWNGSCLSSCGSPLTQRTEGTKQYCDYPCATTQYLYWNGTCGNVCTAPLLTRTEGSRNFCDYPCAASGQYLYWNGTCVSTCASPLSPRTEASRQYCDYPCSSSQYLYWNTTCSNNCPTPLSTRTEAGKQYCDYPCAVTGQYLYWNSSCFTTCASPLSTRTEASRQYCDYPCSSTQYLYWNATCGNNCASPLSTRTTSGKQYCDYPCTPAQFLYADGTCSSTCSAPLTTRTEGSRQFCDYPCYPSQYLYWNGSCGNTCNSPYSPRATNGQQYCDSSCAGGYVYWNASCLTTCDPPFIRRTTSGNQYCDFPCSANQYLSWTGTCLNTCAFPLTQRTTGGRQYCDYPCTSNQQLYPNGTCQTSCSSPYVSQTVSTDKYCNPPCNATQYLYPDGSCQTFCQNPFVESQDSSGVKHCEKPCALNEFRILNGSCITSCISPLVVKAEVYGNTCSSPCANPFDYYHVATQTCDSVCNTIATNVDGMYLKCAGQGVTKNATQIVNKDVYVIKVSGLYESLTEPGSSSIIAYTKMLNYIPLLNVDKTPRLQRLAQSQTRPLLSFDIIPGMPSSLADAFSSSSGRRLQSISSTADKPLAFFVNYWGDMIMLIMSIAFALIFEIAADFARDKGKLVLHALFSKLRAIAKWSFCILLFATNISDVILFAALQFTSPTSGGAGVASLILCVVTVILTLVFLGFMFWLLRKAKQQRIMPLISTIGVISKAESKISTLPPKWNNFQIITRGIKDNTTLNQYFFFLYTVRAFLPMFLACCLYRMPVAQGAFQVIISVLILGFIISQRPLKSTMNHVQLIIIEAITMQVNLCVFIFVILSKQGKVNSEFTVFVGDVIILGNIVINCVLIVFLIIKLTITVQKILKVYNKSKGLMDKTLWLQLLVPFIQQTAFGFEELLLDLSNEGIAQTGRISPIRHTAENRTEGDHTNRLFIQKEQSEQMVVLKPESETDQSKIMGHDGRSLEEFIPQFSPASNGPRRAPSNRKLGQAPQNNQPDESPTADENGSASDTDIGRPTFGGGMPRNSIDTKDKMCASFIQKARPSALLTASNLSAIDPSQSPGQNQQDSTLMDSFSLTEQNVNSPATATKKLLNGRPSIFKRNNNQLLNGLDESMRQPNSPGYSPLESKQSIHNDRPMDKSGNRFSSFIPITSIEIEDILGAPGGESPRLGHSATPRGSLLQTIKDQFNPTHRRSSLNFRSSRNGGGDSTPSRFGLKRNDSRSEQFE